MREAEPLHVFDELLGQLAVVESDPPRTQVDFIDTHRGVLRIPGGARLHPLVVLEGVRGLDDAGSGQRRDFRAESERIGFLHPVPMPGLDLELVARPCHNAGDEQLPYPRGAE
jgi:hypothetical protein